MCPRAVLPVKAHGSQISALGTQQLVGGLSFKALPDLRRLCSIPPPPTSRRSARNQHEQVHLPEAVRSIGDHRTFAQAAVFGFRVPQAILPLFNTAAASPPSRLGPSLTH